MSHYQSHHASPNHYDSDPSFSHHKKSSSSSSNPRKLEEDLRSTVSFLVKTLQKEFLKSTNPQNSTSSATERGHGSSTSRGAASGGEFQEVLYKGKKKLEKLMKKYKEVAGYTGSTSRSRSVPHYDDGDEGYGYGASNTPAYGAPGYIHTPDDIEEVESVRSSRRHRSSRHHKHHDSSVPRAPSPPYTGPHGRTVYDDGDQNPDYYSSGHGHANGFSSSSSATKKSTAFSLDNVNLPLLIERAAMVLGIIEKVLVMKAGGSSSGHHSSRSGSGHGGSGGAAVGIVTAVKIVRMVLALNEGAVKDERRHTR